MHEGRSHWIIKNQYCSARQDTTDTILSTVTLRTNGSDSHVASSDSQQVFINLTAAQLLQFAPS